MTLTVTQGQGTDVVQACGSNQVRVWRAAHAWALWVYRSDTNVFLPGVAISIDKLVSTDASLAKACPDGGKYLDFILKDGPVCSAGHRIPRALKREMQIRVSGVLDFADLKSSLLDEVPAVRAMAVQSMKSLHLSDEQLRVIVSDVLHDSDPTVRYAATSQFPGIRAPTSDDIAQLGDVFSGDADGAVRGMAAFALGEIGGAQACGLLVGRFLKESDEHVRTQIVLAVTRIRSNEAIHLLQAAQSDPSEAVRREAKAALLRMDEHTWQSKLPMGSEVAPESHWPTK